MTRRPGAAGSTTTARLELIGFSCLRGINARNLELPDQSRELVRLASGIRHRDGHDEQLIQAHCQEIGETICDDCFVTGDDQAVDEGIGHCAIRGNGKARVGEYASGVWPMYVIAELLVG